MQGKIVKGISGFYYVYVAETGIYECKAKGIFRNRKIKPLVGDDVTIAVLDEVEKTGNIEEILPRRTELVRPAVANIDMALLVFAVAKPDPVLNLLDRFLCMMEYQKVPAMICFNKCDLADRKAQDRLKEIYEPAGYRICFTSVKTGENTAYLREFLHGKTTAVAGPSGVGKSSLINSLQDSVQMETGAVSEKTARGRHTTRHSQFIVLGENTYIMDTPGFSSMDLLGFTKDRLGMCYPEFVRYEPMCRFAGCSHIEEPGCGVKNALREGKISPVRYENYKILYEEMKNRKTYT